MKLHKTRIDLPEKIRRKMVGLLNQQLADVLDLQLQAKQAHWNVEGPGFMALHELFDKIEEQVHDFADDLAERAVALGGVALGTARIAAKSSRLREYPLDIHTSRKHVTAMAIALSDFGKFARAGIETAAGAGDAGTADLFTQLSRGTDKLLWFVEAHAEDRE